MSFDDQIYSFLVNEFSQLKFNKSKLHLSGRDLIIIREETRKIQVVTIPMNFFKDGKNVDLLSIRRSSTYETIFLYEDVWLRDSLMFEKRMAAHLGKARNIYARNCEIREITNELASTFLSKNHSYGWAKAKYCYGLFRYRKTGVGEIDKIGDDISPNGLVAVASFSQGLKMKHEDSRMSYEWVRYASLPDVRVLGGMGKMLKHFIKNVEADEVMSFSDDEWSSGDVYSKLGFKIESRRKAVEFIIDMKTFHRISVQKILHDKKYAMYKGLLYSNAPRIWNLGSTKWRMLGQVADR
ncbi:MAG: hypothetical protein WCS34_05685 [Bacteroidales bacterium]